MLNQTYASFKQLYKVFNHLEMGKDSGERLLTVKQGVATDFSLTFHTLTAKSGWNEFLLKTVFPQGLNNMLQADLAS